MGIDRNNAIFVGELVKVRESCHVVSILVAAMQKNNDWIVLLSVIAFGQMHDESAGNIIDDDLILIVLRPGRCDEEQHREAGAQYARLAVAEGAVEFLLV